MDNCKLFNNKFQNPLKLTYPDGRPYEHEVADPTLIRGEDGAFYLFPTERKMFKSYDCCHFVLVEEELFKAPTWWQELYDEKTHYGVWAPDVVKVGDKWIYYYSLSGWGLCCGIGYAVADCIEGPYTDMGKLFSYKELDILNAIDPQVFYDNGHLYMVLGSFQGLFIIELEADGMSLKNGKEYQKNNKTLIAGRVGPWDGSTYEGSYIIKKDGYYYYFGSVGTCCEHQKSTYAVYCARSKNVLGPYLDSKGNNIAKAGLGITYGDLVLWADNAVMPLAGPGHNSIYKDELGDYFICYHCYHEGDGYKNRHAFLDKLEWNEEGFPYVSHKDGICIPSYHLEQDGPKINK